MEDQKIVSYKSQDIQQVISLLEFNFRGIENNDVAKFIKNMLTNNMVNTDQDKVKTDK